MIVDKGAYVSRIWLVNFQDPSPVELLASLFKAEGADRWTFRLRVRYIRDDKVGSESADTKEWYSGSVATKEDGIANWKAWIEDFIQANGLKTRQVCALLIESASGRRIAQQIATLPGVHVLDSKTGKLSERSEERLEKMKAGIVDD